MKSRIRRGTPESSRPWTSGPASLRLLAISGQKRHRSSKAAPGGAARVWIGPRDRSPHLIGCEAFVWIILWMILSMSSQHRRLRRRLLHARLQAPSPHSPTLTYGFYSYILPVNPFLPSFLSIVLELILQRLSFSSSGTLHPSPFFTDLILFGPSPLKTRGVPFVHLSRLATLFPPYTHTLPSVL